MVKSLVEGEYYLPKNAGAGDTRSVPHPRPSSESSGSAIPVQTARPSQCGGDLPLRRLRPPIRADAAAAAAAAPDPPRPPPRLSPAFRPKNFILINRVRAAAPYAAAAA